MKTSPHPLARVAAALAAAALTLLVPATASAHGSTESNLDDQVLEIAPDRAEFVYSGDVDRASARASLRYLGYQELSAEDYFRFDVPTVELERAEPLTGTGPEFAFSLPRLAAGSYAIDWEVTPVGDHLDSSVTFFQVIVGVSDPSPIPPVPADVDSTPSLTGAEEDAGSVASSSPSPGAGPALWFALVGVIALVAVFAARYVFRDRGDRR